MLFLLSFLLGCSRFLFCLLGFDGGLGNRYTSIRCFYSIIESGGSIGSHILLSKDTAYFLSPCRTSIKTEQGGKVGSKSQDKGIEDAFIHLKPDQQEQGFESKTHQQNQNRQH